MSTLGRHREPALRQPSAARVADGEREPRPVAGEPHPLDAPARTSLTGPHAR
ncbi:GNAT family N-acetyltransferase, partial [Streptomyces sp. ZEA17I]